MGARTIVDCRFLVSSSPLSSAHKLSNISDQYYHVWIRFTAWRSTNS